MELCFVADTLSFLRCYACLGLQGLRERIEGLGAQGAHRRVGGWGRGRPLGVATTITVSSLVPTHPLQEMGGEDVTES